jgi:hypothetical protein
MQTNALTHRPPQALLRRLHLAAGLALAALSTAGCNVPGAMAVLLAEPTALSTPTAPPTATGTPTKAATPTPTGTITRTPTITPSPSPSLSPTITPTPTDTLPPTRTPTITPTPEIRGRVLEQANCRYGPGAAYLYEWGLFPANRVTVLGRNQDGSWLYVDPWTYTDKCWVKADLLELNGDISALPQLRTLLPYTEFYWPPKGVSASRSGDEVTVSWSLVPMSLDDNRGYLIEAFLCQDGQLRFTPVQYWEPPAVLIDEVGCMEPSSARIYTAEKHGYTQWILIRWPPHPDATAAPSSPQ